MREKPRGYAAAVIRHRRAVLVAAAVLALVGAALSPTLFGKLTAGGFDDPDGESARAAALLHDRFGQGEPNLVLLVSTPSGVDQPAAVAAGEELTRRVAAEAGVTDVVSYWSAGRVPHLRSTAGDRALILGSVTGEPGTVDERVTGLVERYQADHAGLTVAVGGYAPFEHELTEQSERDVAFGEAVVFPVTLVLLLLIFGSVLAAALPLLVALITTLVGMGLMWVVADLTELSVFAANVITLLGLGLAIDYSLLMVHRYREELRSGRPPGEAIPATLRSAGRTVVFSALTVAVALSALVWFPLPALRSVSYAGIATALIAGAVSLTVLPALFAVWGTRLGRVRRPRRHTGPADPARGFWHRLATLVMCRPVPVATLAAAFLLLLGAPFLGLKLGWVDERVMPESSPARQVASVVRTEFGSGEQDVVQVVAPRATGGPRALAGYAVRLSALPGVSRVDTATGSYAGGELVTAAGPAHQRFTAGEAAHLAVVPVPGQPEDTQQLVRDVRRTAAPFEVLVGGTAATTVDSNDALLAGLPYGVAALAVVMLVLLFLLTRSVLLPVLALVLSGLSLTATFGALVWVFQEGHLTGLVGEVTVTGTTPPTVPVMLFAIAFGLAMDYQVFMLSRIREEYQRTGDSAAAVATGLQRMGRIVTAAAVLISIVFLAFLLSDISLMKAFGVGLALAVLLDATVVRGALLPAVMKLGGRAVWWVPRPLRRIHDRLGLREEAPEPVPAAPRA